MGSSVSPTYGDQEGTAYNGRFACTWVKHTQSRDFHDQERRNPVPLPPGSRYLLAPNTFRRIPNGKCRLNVNYLTPVDRYLNDAAERRRIGRPSDECWFTEERTMAGELAGKTITITMTKSTTPDEIAHLMRRAYAATVHPNCGSGAVLVAREAVVHTDPSGTITIG
jgi:hypothetical protein